jgi:formate dehydrogenase subunit gamma
MKERKRVLAKHIISATILLLLILPLVPYALNYMEGGAAGAVANPGADLWRAVRERDGKPSSATRMQSVDAAQLINVGGENWRQFRMGKLVPIGAWILIGVFSFIALFRLIRGKVPLYGGRSGKLVPRFSVNQRVVHWFAAFLLTVEGITGLVLLYGRFVLAPLLGPEGFSATAAASKEIHNLFGPIFPVAVLLILVLFLRGNSPRMIDLKWFMKGGGLLKGKPASSGYYNGGQKSWFWMVVVFGLAISISGLILDFPVFGQGREIMGWAHVVHGVVAVLFIAASLGHIYIGTIGMEGAFESMSHGYVDANWAEEHHDLWFQEMEKAGMVGVEPNALEEVKRHDDVDFRGFGSPGVKAKEG